MVFYSRTRKKSKFCLRPIPFLLDRLKEINGFNYNELFLNLGNPAFLLFTSHLSAAKSNIKINSIFPYMYNKPFGLQLCTSNKCHQSSLSVAEARHCVGSKNVYDRAFHNVIRGTKGRIFQNLLT